MTKKTLARWVNPSFQPIRVTTKVITTINKKIIKTDNTRRPHSDRRCPAACGNQRNRFGVFVAESLIQLLGASWNSNRRPDTAPAQRSCCRCHLTPV